MVTIGRYKHVLSIGIAAVLLVAIFVPLQRASAFSLNVGASSNSYPSNGGPSSYTVSLNIQPSEFIPVQSVLLNLDGVTVATYDISGNLISSSSNAVSLGPPSVSHSNGNAYGYGFSFGYGYEYIGGYTHPSSSTFPGFMGPGTVSWTGTINPSLIAVGPHQLQVVIDTGTGSGQNSFINSTPFSFSVFASGGGGGGTGTLFVNSVDSNGAPLTGLEMDLRQGLTLIDHEFSPATFTLVAGETYVVYASDFGNDVFDHWSDGTQTRGHIVSVGSGGSVSLTAVYNTGSTSGHGHGGGTTPITLSITSRLTNGTTITGQLNEVVQGDSPVFSVHGLLNLIGTGNTPDSYQLQSNTRYTVFASDSGRYVFDHWEDSSGNHLNHHATLRGALIDSSTDLSLVAVYVDLGQNPVVLDISHGISLVHLAQGQALLINITSVPGTPITIPVMFTGLPGSGLVTITLNGIVGTGTIVLYAEGVPDAAGHSVHLPGSTFTIGGTSTTGGIVLEIDTSAISFDPSVPNAITITVPYDHIAALNAGIPENTGHIKLFHFDGQNWVDITTSIDTINHTVTGQIGGGSASPVGAGYAPSSSNPGPIVNPTQSSGGGGGSSGPAVFISAPSEANPITVTTDKQSYSSGDTIHISGAVAKVVSGQGMFISITNPNGALYRADTIVPNSDGSYSYDLKIGGKLGPSGMYTVKVTYAQSSAQATFTFTNTTGGGMQTYTLNIDGKNYQIQYMITGGKLLNMTMDTGAKTLTANIDSTSNGTLTLVLPRSVIDSQENGKDIDFNVFADGVAHADFTEQNTTADSRTLAINFDNGTQKIEVVGTNAVPEFGPIAALVLVIAIIGTIVATTRFRKSGFGFSSGNSLQ